MDKKVGKLMLNGKEIAEIESFEIEPGPSMPSEIPEGSTFWNRDTDEVFSMMAGAWMYVGQAGEMK